MKKLQEYVLLDFETTGLDASKTEIIEIGAIRVSGFEEVSRFHRLVRPVKGTIPKLISDLTGITNEMVADAPTLEEVAREFADFLGDTPIVAHNSSLEQSFLDEHVSPKVGGVSFTVHNSIDPMALLLPDNGSHSMESLRKWAGVDFENAHRADKDCIDLLKILKYAQDWMIRERPWMGALVSELLSGWWWEWFFEAGLDSLEDHPTVLDLLRREPLGDLKELTSLDEAKEVPEKLKISASAIETALHPKDPSRPFEFRKSQAQMSENIRVAFEKGEKIAIEAPTGTGKSVAYLIPGVLASKAAESPLVVSTHSKALQDQLFEKDIPLAGELLKDELGGKPIRSTTVKGQENYLCLRKLHQEVLFSPPPENEGGMQERYALATLVALSKVSRVAELDRVSNYIRGTVPPMEALIERVRSHYTTTKGPPCPFYKSCHFFNSARIAHQSDVVIANHSLVFHWPDHMPKIRNLVFDEAHHLEDQITDAYSLSTTELDLAHAIERLSSKTKNKRLSDGSKIQKIIDTLTLPTGSSGEKTIGEFAETLAERMRETSISIQAAVTRKRSRDSNGYEESLDLATLARDPVMDSLKNLSDKVASFVEFLNAAVKAVNTGPLKTDPAADLLQLQAFKFSEFQNALKAAIDGESEESKNRLRLLLWNPRESLWKVRVHPIGVKEHGKEFFADTRSVVMTSATLSSGANPTFVTDRIGVELSKPFISLPSPYPLEKQAIAFLPSDVPQPGTPGHLEHLIGFTESVARILGGRTLLLMTANHRLKAAAEALRAKLEPHGIQVFDSVSDRRAIDAFRSTEKAVLIGSERYGEGVDIPGRQLACVIVEKINEAMTRGPLAEARKARTRFGLFDYDFPLRMMWLKQRVGRLIRSPTDRGVVVVFDPRFHSWSAPSQGNVVAALAPMPVRGGTRDDILMQIEGLGI